MGDVLLKIINAGGIGGAIREATNMIVALFGGKIPEKAILVMGLLVAIAIGVFGYKYIKLLCTVIFGVGGYAIGLTAFRMLEVRFAWNVPSFVDYLVGVLVLALLGYLAYKKFAYALFVIAAAIGFLIGYFIYPSYLLGAIFAVIVAMVTMNFVRYGFVSILSISAGFIFMGMISALVPSLRLFSLTEGFVGKLLAIMIAIVFIVIQLQFSRKETKKFSSGTKRVKIRRVFDTW